MTMLSGVQAGAENVKRLTDYLEGLATKNEPLPERNGGPDKSAIALACGFDRQVLYKNPAAKRLLDDAVERSMGRVVRDGQVEGSPVAAATDRRDRRIHELEQANVALRAEVAGLRERLRRLTHVEAHMIETGRGVAPLLPSLGETGT